MPNRAKKYYVGDDVTFRGTFKVDGVAQTPDASSGAVVIMQRDNASTIVSTTATISGSQVRYKYTPLVIGRFACFLTAAFGTGADKRTGVIEFVVKKKEAH